MTLRSKHIVPIVLAAFIIGIGGTMIFNLWQTKSSKVPATYTSGEFAGTANPADIRGSYSFGDIQEAFAVPVEALAAAFGVRDVEKPAAFLCKSLEDMYGEMENGEIGTDSVRLFVALYAGLPYTAEEDTLLPESAVPVLKDRLSQAELEELNTRTVSLDPAGNADQTDQEETETASAESHTETEIGQVRGQTTFGELISWGVSKEIIEEALGLPIGKPGIAVRDFCIENGIEFSSVKTALQTAADRALEK